ncbi:MAG: TnsD family Tn7-like transposition protein [Marinisporobacter sp.]|jgi:hypothetical protein|nr:TnsD family Tn7-like transposition protein [Marinisporobacter sp.]
MDFNVEEERDIYVKDKFIEIGNTAKFLLDHRFENMNKKTVHEKYKKLLDHKELLTVNKGIKQKELHEAFVGYYGENLLEKLDSDIDKDNEYNWLKAVSRNYKRAVHPLRHILFINFLSNAKEFFNSNKGEYNPFGRESWPCLNPVADHYKEDVINNLKITADYKTREPVGTFTCDCGFIYSRKGPDKCNDDRYKIGRIKEFGHVWKSKLKVYLQEGKYGLRELGRIMKCDPKTILKFDAEFGIYHFEKSKEIDVNEDKKSFNKVPINMDEYKNKIVDLIKEHPNMSRTEIRELCKKEYSYLYKHDKAWLYEVLPGKKPVDSKREKIVDWKKRDEEILELVKTKYKELMNRDKPVRITLSRIGRELGILSTLEKKVDKLPQTKAHILEIVELTRDFQIRRSKKIIDKQLEEKGIVKLWKVQQSAKIRKEAFDEIRDVLEDYINRGNYH